MFEMEINAGNKPHLIAIAPAIEWRSDAKGTLIVVAGLDDPLPILLTDDFPDVVRPNDHLGVQPHIIETIINHVSGYKAGVASERSRTKTRTRANEGYFAVQR